MQDGKIYESISETAKKYNIDQGALSNHLRNKPVTKYEKNGKNYTYYIRTLKGYTFKYEGDKE